MIVLPSVSHCTMTTIDVFSPRRIRAQSIEEGPEERMNLNSAWNSLVGGKLGVVDCLPSTAL
jgi:hypothetical protein